MLETTLDASATLAGRRILIVEDEFLIADEISRTLQARGANIVGAVASVKKALALLQAETGLDAAIVDINLAGEMAYPVVEALVALHKPVVFATTFHSDQVPARYRTIPLCSKPMQPRVLLRELERLFDSRTHELSGVLIVDDAEGSISTISNDLRRQGLEVEYFRSSDAFLQTVYRERSGFVLLMASANNPAALRRVGEVCLSTHSLPIVVIATLVDVRFAIGAVKAGAIDVVDMSSDHDGVLDSLHKAFGERIRHDGPQSQMGENVTPAETVTILSPLTVRQREILSRIMLGHPNKIIAAALGVSQRTVENHRAAIMKRLGVSSISALVKAVMAAG